jgi:hypothetical protein
MRLPAVFCLLLCSSVSLAKPTQHPAPARVVERGLPIMFEPASGLGDSRLSMIGRVAGMTVAFRPAAIVVEIQGKKDGELQIEFAGAQPTVPAGAELQKSQTNYLMGNHPQQWRTHVPNYGRVKYAGLYPGIDAVFYGNGHQLEHDFIVSPGADYREIRLHLSSNAHATLGKDGALSISVNGGSLGMQKPFIYQEQAGKREQRMGSFRLLPDGDIGFSVASYDPRRDLIIDPLLSFSTYLSNLSGYPALIATDANGLNYVSGSANLGFPVTPNAVAGCRSCTTDNPVTYVSKLSADGTSLLYSTVLGGNSGAQPTGIAVDANGNVIISGWTGASDFPTKNGQPIFPQNNNVVGFLLSLSPDGSNLNYSTLLGSSPSSGSSTDTYATAVALDISGNAYVTGETGYGFHTTPGALNQGNGSIYAGPFNVYLAKFTSTGSLVYSAVVGDASPYHGGGGPTGASAIAVDADGNAYVAGQAGALWPIASNAYLKQIAGPNASPFVTKVAPDAKSLAYSTYLDYAVVVTGVVVLPSGNLLVAGNSPAPSYPTSPDAFQQNSGHNGGFLTQLDSTGSNLVYSTVIGDGTYSLYGLALDPNGDIWLAASSKDWQFPMVAPLESTFPGTLPFQYTVPGPWPDDASSLVYEFDASGKTLKFSTFLGGSVGGFVNSIAVDSSDRVHIAGAAGSGMYTTPGVYRESVSTPDNGYTDYPYVALIDPLPAPALCIAPNFQLGFSDVGVGTFADQQLTITSCGAQPLTIDRLFSASDRFTVPAFENGCSQSIAVGKSCTLGVRFSPTLLEFDSSILTIESNATMPAFLRLSGFAAPAPATVLSPASLNFTSQEVGTLSKPQTVTLTNSGSVNVASISIAITGTNAESFAQTNTCGILLRPGSSCTISVIFQPKAAGAASATLTIGNNLISSLQFVTLSGTAPQTSFAISTQAGGNTSSTVTAGQSATYALSVLPAGGYSGTLALTCGNIPLNASCSFTPASLAIAGGSATSFTVTISTKSVGSGALVHTMGLTSLVASIILLLPVGRRRRMGATTATLIWLVFMAAIGVSGCGGGNSPGAGSGSSQEQGTVARGTYTVQLIASDGTTKLLQPLTLIVQ